MDDEPILDCIVVATRTDSSPTMAPESKPSTTAGHAAGKVHDPARDGPEQNQRPNKSSSSSTAATPESRHIQGNKTAVSSAASKGPPPAARAAPGSKRPPAFPSTFPPAKQSPSSSTVHERPPKRNHDDAFPPNSNRDLGRQPVRYSQDPTKDAKNLGQTESRHTSARLEVISISSDNDEEPDSDDEPLAVIRKRKTTSITPNPAGSQQKKQAPAKIPSRTSSSAPNTQIRTSTPLESHAQSWPSTASKGQNDGHVSLTRSEHAATPHFDNEKKELRAKIEQKETENQTLAKQLRQARALSWTTNQSKLADERELSALRQELGARIQQTDALVSEKDSLNESITKLRDEVSQEKEDANQSLITHKHREAELQKLLDDQVTKNMDLEATVRDLQKADSSKTDGAKITELEASIRELKKRGTQLEGDISQTREDNEKTKGQRDRMLEEKEEIKAERDRLQLRLLEVEELQKQVSSQGDEIREYEKQVSNLHEEVEWYKGNRERIKKEWDERVAMETKWREDLQAAINDSRMNLEQMRRAVLAAPDPTRQAAQSRRGSSSGGGSRASR